MEFVVYFIKSTAILGIFYGVYILWLQNETHFGLHRAFLLLGILVSFGLPLLIFQKIIFVSPPPIVFEGPENLVPVQDSIAQSQLSIFEWWQVLIAIYSGGIIVLLIRFFIHWLSITKSIKKQPTQKNGNIHYVKVEESISPFSFFNTIVFNPKMHSGTDLDMILRHEEIHVVQKHSIDILLANLLVILQWTNPIAWLYKKAMEQNLEFIADSKAVDNNSIKKIYQLALINISVANKNMPATLNFHQSSIKRRIIMLNKKSSPKIQMVKIAVILPILALFLYSFNVKEVIKYKEINPTNGNQIENILSNDAEISERTITNEINEYGLGENPLYIINGKKYRKATVPQNRTIISDSIIKLSKEEGVKQYGKIGEDGVLEFVGNAYLVEMTENPHPDTKQVNKAIATTVGKDQSFKIKISKNTTVEDLEALKSQLKNEHNIDFTYDNLKYNTEGELIAIAVSMGDDDNSMANYNINQTTPIQDFYLYRNEEGNLGIGFFDNNFEPNEPTLANRKSMMQERIVKMQQDQSERQAKMMEGQEERKAKMEEKRNEMRQRMAEIKDEQDTIFQRHQMEMEKNQRYMEEEQKINRENQETYSSDHRNRHNSLPKEKLKTITKDMTDEQLNSLATDFAQDNVDFSYSDIKRNNAGEITRIKITLKNNTGSKNSSSFNNNGLPIAPIVLGMDQRASVMSNKF